MESTSARCTVGNIPPLADSDVELWTDFLGDYISVWLRNSRQFIDKQQEKMLQTALCPFLFGVTQSLPQAWLEVLQVYGIIDKDRENATSPLSDAELETLDMVETIFMRCSQLVDNKNDLKTILNFIYDVEERSALSGRIDMNYALQEVIGLEVFASMWAPIKRFYEKRKRQAHICIIYYFKIISHHVTLYGQNGTDKFEYIKSMVANIRMSGSQSLNLLDASLTLHNGNYRLALEQFSELIEKEPLNPRLYSSRLEAYIHLGDVRGAMSDCKRTIVLDSTNHAHFYKASGLYLQAGMLDKAEELCNQAFRLCTDPLHRKTIQHLGMEIQAKLRIIKDRVPTYSSAGEERVVNSIQYRKFLVEGCDLYQSHQYTRAAEQFKAALDVLARSSSQELAVEGDQLAFLWLIYGLSCVKTEHARVRPGIPIVHNAQAAVEKFNAVISQTDTFPAAYYGLGLAYMALRRYQEADTILKTGLARLKECKEIKRYLWPRSNKIVEETCGATLKKLMEDLLKETMFPPKPDAICRFHVDTDSLKKEMYFSDSDYKGHICIKCRADCSIDFHAQCWKTSDGNSRTKHNWKEVLDTPCPTPGCWGLICEVYIFRPGLDKTLKLSSQTEVKLKVNQPRSKLKMKTQSTSKLERKNELKRLRKERRQEARQMHLAQQTSEAEVKNASPRIFLPPVDEEIASVNIDRSGTVLRKDEPEILLEQRKQKAIKVKKKEKKQKQFLPVDVQFKGDENKERYGINSLDEDGDFVSKSSTLGLLPTPGTEPCIVPDETHQRSALEIALYQFFYQMLLSKGSLDLFSKDVEDHIRHLSEEAQTYIHSYGGLGKFLASHRQFNVSQNIVTAVPIGQLRSPHLASQVNSQLKPQVTLQLKPRMNPWEARLPKPAEVAVNEGQGLNPGAKEFVPQDSATAPASSHISLGELKEHAGKSDTNEELPPPADDDDDNGFTTVVNKRRTNLQKVPSAIQPQLLKMNYLKATSSMNSLDEINLHSQLPQTPHSQSNVTAQEASKDQAHVDTPTSASHGKMDSLDTFCDDVDHQTFKRMGAVDKQVDLLQVTNQSGQGCDVSNASMDAQYSRVSSPALSTNSGSSSSRADGSQNSQSAGQSAIPRPLKAPSIILPTRGKKKKLPGYASSKLYSHLQLPQGDDNQVCDRYEEESVSSTTSDRESTCEDPRPFNSDGLHMSGVGVSSTTHNSSGANFPAFNQDISFSLIHDISLQHANKLNKNDGFNKDVFDDSDGLLLSDKIPGGIMASDSGLNDETKLQEEEIWFQNLTAKKHDFHLLDDLRISDRSPHHTDEMHDINVKETFSVDNVLVQAPIQRPQSQMLNLATGSSDSQPTVNARTLLDTTWPSWEYGLSDGYERSNDKCDINIRVPPSDPWNKQDQITLTFYDHLFQKNSELQAMCPEADVFETSKMMSSDPDNGAFSGEFGPIGSGQVKDNDPWILSSFDGVHADDTIDSYTSDITFHRRSPLLSPFAAWRNIPNSASSNEMNLISTCSTKINTPSSVSSTKMNFPNLTTSTEMGIPSSTTFMEPPKTSVVAESTIYTSASTSELLFHKALTQEPQEQSISETEVESNVLTPVGQIPPRFVDSDPEKITHSWRLQHLDRDDPKSSAISTRTVDIQTDIIGTRMDEMLMSVSMLKNSQTQLASTQHEKLELQKQLDLAKSALEKLRLDNEKLAARIQVAETSNEKWKDDNSQLIVAGQLLNKQVREQSDSITKLNQQLQLCKTTALNAQAEALEFKKDLVITRISMKQQEAMYHLQRLSSVITQAKTLGKQLPESVCEKQAEFSEYIATCDRLNRHIQVVFLRLANDLQRGLDITMSDLDINPPAFPKSPTESSDRTQAPSSHPPPLVSYSNGVRPSPPHSVSSTHSDSTHDSKEAGQLTMSHSSREAGQLPHTSREDGLLAPPSYSTRESGLLPPPSHSIRKSGPLPPQRSSREAALQPTPPPSYNSRESDLLPSPAHNSRESGLLLPPPPPPPHSNHSVSSVFTSSLRTSSPDSLASTHSSPSQSRVRGHSSSPLFCEPQRKAFTSSAAQSEVEDDRAEDEDAEAYLRMIYGESSSANSSKLKVAAAGSRSQQKETHKPRIDSSLATSKLPAALSMPDTRVLPGLRQPNHQVDISRTDSNPNMRLHSKPFVSQNVLKQQQQQQQLSYFERIIHTVQDKWPGYSRNDIQKIIDSLRRSSGGTLSSWTFETLVNEILNTILNQKQEQSGDTFTRSSIPDKHLLTSTSTHNTQDFVCSICQCEGGSLEKLTLSCGHRFHKDCVNKWLKTDRTCPNCRTHALLPQDFPTLK